VGSEWSNSSTDVTPSGGRRFLGQFTNDTVRLTLDNLPAHTQAVLSFDLFILKTWDGNDNVFGPDHWGLRVVGGNTLLDTTFSQYDSLKQAYPDWYPGGNHPAHTGAAEINTLGYTFRDGDSVYNLSFAFPHSGSSLAFEFWGSGLQSMDDESWGLDNVSVNAVPEPATMQLLVGAAIAGLLFRLRKTRT
jgi:hypothetical protein